MFECSIAMFQRTSKEFIRNRAVLFWTIGWPAIWVVLDSMLFTGWTPEELLPQTKGFMTINMIGFALMTAGMANLAGFISRDKERGVYQKIVSMPIKAWEDALGRLLGLLTFTFFGSTLVLIVGFVMGAKFGGSTFDVLQGIAYAFLIILSTSGIGLILGSMVKYEGTAINIGVGLTVLTASISGLFAPYNILPEILQRFSQLYPPSAAAASINYALQREIAVELFTGYNPLTQENIVYLAVSSITIFIVGLMVYKQKIWTRHL